MGPSYKNGVNAFFYGACNNYINKDGNEEAFLCFAENERDGCIRYENI